MGPTVMFFPTYASRDEATGQWRVDLHAWAYDIVTDSTARRALTRLFRRTIGLKKEDARSATYERRAGLFLVNARKKLDVLVRLGDREHPLGATRKTGHLRATLLLEPEVVAAHADADGLLPFVPTDPQAPPTAPVRLIEPTGVSVLSDIDDTIKASYVWKKRKLIRTTFTRAWKPTKGLAAVYRRLAEAGAQFHYVSTAPWQLYPSLAQFAQRAGYPSGTFHLKRFRWKDRSFFDLFAKAEGYKPRLIEPILTRFPGRAFILVGDSGEHDPEVYGRFARRHPDQVAMILIRDVTGEPADHDRYRAAFDGIDPARWRLFAKASHIGEDWVERVFCRARHDAS